MGTASLEMNALPRIAGQYCGESSPLPAGGDIAIAMISPPDGLGGGSSLVRALMGDEVVMLIGETVIQVLRKTLRPQRWIGQPDAVT